MPTPEPSYAALIKRIEEHERDDKRRFDKGERRMKKQRTVLKSMEEATERSRKLIQQVMVAVLGALGVGILNIIVGHVKLG